MYRCITCDCLWEEHETLYETREERMFLKKPVGKNYLYFYFLNNFLHKR